MQNNTNKKMIFAIVATALMAAASIVLEKIVKIDVTPTVRISIGNMPIILCGMLLGPLFGGLCGAVADLVGCAIVGYAVNPFITAGAVFIGAFGGFAYRYMFKNSKIPIAACVYIAVSGAHLIGSVLIKSVGFMVFYSTPPSIIWIRLATYLPIIAAEGYIIYLLAKNQAVNRAVGGRFDIKA